MIGVDERAVSASHRAIKEPREANNDNYTFEAAGPGCFKERTPLMFLETQRGAPGPQAASHWELLPPGTAEETTPRGRASPERRMKTRGVPLIGAGSRALRN
ncbi:hypothetical protein ISCGN_000578 [Ixodes scapularis]